MWEQIKGRVFLIGIFIFISAVIGFLAMGAKGCVTHTEEREVQGDSLSGLVEPGQKVELVFGYYGCHEIKRGDIVAYKFAGSQIPLIKRAVGIPGDDWQMVLAEDQKYNLIINGETQKTTGGEAYRFSEQSKNLLALYKSPIGTEQLLILGNIASGSNDSSRFGLASRKNILARVKIK